MKMRSILAEAFREWKEDDAMQWGAALSYYAALALAPFLLVVLWLAGLVLEGGSARDALVGRVGLWMGSGGAELAREILQPADDEAGRWARLAGGVLLVVSASGIFTQLQKAMNDIWDVVPAGGGWRRMIRSRILGFLMVATVGVLLPAAMAAQAWIAAAPLLGPLIAAVNLLVSLALFTALFGAVFRILPDAAIRWRDVLFGASATALLFVAGQLLIGLYLGRFAPGSRYGAAGSLVVVLVWIYYSSQVFFFGAELTQVWARRHGRRIEPDEGARRQLPASERADGEEEGREGREGRGAAGPPPRGLSPGASYP